MRSAQRGFDIRGKIVQGTLTLDDKSKTEINYGRDTNQETLVLIFRVAWV